MSALINDKLKAFIEGPHGMSIGTRDSDLVPEYSRAIGAYVTGSSIIKVHIAKINSERALNNLEDNGMTLDLFNQDSLL